MTYKSFTTLDELFELLVRRFHIQPPNNLTLTELEEWKRLKQHIIQMRFAFIIFVGDILIGICRVLNTFKAMVADDDFLEKEDMYILDRMKEFLLQDAVSRIAISKQLVILIDRAVCNVRPLEYADSHGILSEPENSRRPLHRI